MSPPDAPALPLSVVAPAHNEEDNIRPLVDEVERALAPLAARGPGPAAGVGGAGGVGGVGGAGGAGGVGGVGFEFILVDDGSTDATRRRILELIHDPDHPRPWLRCVAMTRTPPGRGNGQSAAFHAGFRAARGRLIAVLDADLQNDPADIPRMLELLERENADFVQGDRSHARKDNWVKRRASEVGRAFRRMILGDSIRDTGCSLRVMKREIALALPLEFRGMHRFIPVTARNLGYKVVEMRVNHRPRAAGETKYGQFGIASRAIPGLIDCFAVRWMAARRRPVDAEEVAGA